MNVIVICVKFVGINKWIKLCVNYSSYFFLLIYNIDQLIKLKGYGGRYLSKVWNQFDLSIVLLADICLGLEMGLGFESLVNAVLAVRVIRLVRLFRLVKRFTEFRVIYKTIYIVLI